MNANGLFGFVAGLLIGAGIGAASSYLISEKKFKDRMDIELAKIPKPEHAPEEKKEEEKKPYVEPEAVIEEGKAEAETLADLYKPDTNKQPEPVDYVGYSPSKTNRKEERKRAKKQLDRNRPYAIDSDTFDETFAEFEKHEEYLYYTESHELVDDETGEIIHDIDGTVGLENMLSFPKSGTQYIRNESIGEDFRVTLVDGRYSADE